MPDITPKHGQWMEHVGFTGIPLGSINNVSERKCLALGSIVDNVAGMNYTPRFPHDKSSGYCAFYGKTDQDPKDRLKWRSGVSGWMF